MSKAKPALDPAVESKLIKAIESRNASAVEQLIATGIDVNLPLEAAHNETPLYLATRYGANEVAVALVKAGADWPEGGLNLVWSVYFADEWLTRKLIELGADPNFKGRTMGRALPLATSHNLLNLMRLLIDAGADVNVDSPLSGAVVANYKEAVFMLLNAGATPAKDQALLPWAAQRKNRDVIAALIKAGADLNERATLSEFNSQKGNHITYCDNATALMIAAATGEEEIVNDLVEAGADLYSRDATGATAVDLAQKCKHPRVVQLLESAMIRRPRISDPTGDLIFASEKGETTLVRELLGAGANLNAEDTRPKSKGLTPLMLAARSGHAQTVAALLDCGADPTLKDKAGADNEAGFNFIFNEGGIEQVVEAGFSMFRTALHWAVENGNADVVTQLVRRGADVNEPDRAKVAPLHIAAQNGFSVIVEALLKAGADPDARARVKQTPLHCASRSGSLETVRVLIQAGAKADLKNDEGNTPLLLASARAHPEVVSALFEAGADPHTADRNLRTAIAKACSSQLYEHKYKGKQIVLQFLRPESEILKTIRVLLAAGADPMAKDKQGSNALDEARRGLKYSKFYAEVIELLQTARPTDAGSALSKRSSKSKAAPAKDQNSSPQDKATEARRKSSPKPDFSTAAGRPEFHAALSDLEIICGTKAQPMAEVKGGFTVHIQSGKQVDLEKTHTKFLERGIYVFSPDSTFDNRFAVLPTTDKYRVLLAMQTNGQNYDLMPEDVVAWLRALETEQPFVLTSAGFDFAGGRFTTRPSKPAALAKRIYEFCPDIVEQGCGDTKALAAELSRTRSFFLWWD